jgi:hypothetical protein
LRALTGASMRVVSGRRLGGMRRIVRDNWIFVQVSFAVKRGNAGAA